MVPELPRTRALKGFSMLCNDTVWVGVNVDEGEGGNISCAL